MLTPLNQDETSALAAFDELLDMTGEDDWHLFHNTVRARVTRGEFSNNFEQHYKALVDKKATVLDIPPQ